MAYQLTLFDCEPAEDKLAKLSNRSGSFVDNMKLPVHRWFRYSAGFSADWVRHVLSQRQASDKDVELVLDPFAGIATTMLACNAERIPSVGFEPHPFVHRIANIKLASLSAPISDIRDTFERFLDYAKRISILMPSDIPSLLLNCYTEPTLEKLFKFKQTYEQHFAEDQIASDLICLVITAILRSCSTAGTAQWQYILPNKKKTKVTDPFLAFQSKATDFLHDIQHAQRNSWICDAQVFRTDARNPEYSNKNCIDFVITSPPYPNNYDYADATRLEMTFWGIIDCWKDLHKTVRKELIRSCSQHSAAEKLELIPLLSNPLLDPIRSELSEACNTLAEVRLQKGGKKTYHTMAAAYFLDLSRVFVQLRKLCKERAEMCFVIGDSAPYGVYLAVDKWLGELAIASGFKDYHFEKIRDRNVKWKNRKHRVPLKEGRLWIKG